MSGYAKWTIVKDGEKCFFSNNITVSNPSTTDLGAMYHDPNMISKNIFDPRRPLAVRIPKYNPDDFKDMYHPSMVSDFKFELIEDLSLSNPSTITGLGSMYHPNMISENTFLPQRPLAVRIPNYNPDDFKDMYHPSMVSDFKFEPIQDFSSLQTVSDSIAFSLAMDHEDNNILENMILGASPKKASKFQSDDSTLVETEGSDVVSRDNPYFLPWSHYYTPPNQGNSSEQLSNSSLVENSFTRSVEHFGHFSDQSEFQMTDDLDTQPEENCDDESLTFESDSSPSSAYIGPPQNVVMSVGPTQHSNRAPIKAKNKRIPSKELREEQEDQTTEPTNELQRSIKLFLSYLEMKKMDDATFPNSEEKVLLTEKFPPDIKERKTMKTAEPISRKNSLRRRKVSSKTVNYEEDPISEEDDYIPCDHCEEAHKGSCPIHGHMRWCRDKKFRMDGSDKLRAFKSSPWFISFNKSNIKSAGLGAWSEIDLPAGCVFGPYEGTIVRDSKTAHKSGYSWMISKERKPHHYVEARDVSRSNWMRFVNCAEDEESQNLIAFQYKAQIYYRTYKPVMKHCELLVYYGDSYAEELGIRGKDEKSEDEADDVSASVKMTKFQELAASMPFSCNQCSAMFRSESDFLSHAKNNHRVHDSSKRFKCSHCSYSTDIGGNLKRHIMVHTGAKPFQCEYCYKGFSELGHLKQHLIVHTKERAFSCEACGKTFSLKGNLKLHIKSIHTKQELFVCSTCKANFSRKSNLKQHESTHTGQKKFKCDQCEYRSAQSGSLKTHQIRYHTHAFPHRCSACGNGFVTPDELRKHEKKCSQY